MNYAIYNPQTNRFSTIVTEATGSVPDGYVFLPENELPGDAVREQPVSAHVFTAKEFLDRFTGAELVGVSTASRTDAVLDVMFRKLTAADMVHSDSPELTQGLTYLVGLGLLSADRRAAILGN